MCIRDSLTTKTYPRATGANTGNGEDYVYNNNIAITAVDAAAGTITVNVNQSPGTPISNLDAHTFVSATANGVTVMQRNALTVTDAEYTPSDGTLVLTIGAGHTLTTSNTVKIAQNSITFQCDLDNYGSDHPYPRATDPVYNQFIAITNANQGANTITVNVGVSSPGTAYPRSDIKGTLTATTGTTYSPVTGLLTIQTTSNHGLTTGDWIKIANNSLTFACDKDAQATDHTYPRPTDPVSGRWLKVTVINSSKFTVEVLDETPSTNVTSHVWKSATADGISIKKDPFFDTSVPIVGVTNTTIQLQVNNVIPQSQTQPHTFISALENSVLSGGNYAHQFRSATAGGLKKQTKALVTGGDYGHTFVTTPTLTPSTAAYDPNTGLMLSLIHI